MSQKVHSVFFSIALALVLHLSVIRRATAQSPAAAPSGPDNITAILEKAREFRTLIRLLRTTQLDKRINAQLNDSGQGMTIFAPTDGAFSLLKPGTLNTLTDEQQVTLIQYHILSSYVPLSQFQFVSNPLSTDAGSTGDGLYPLNVTTAGTHVNISTGITNATVTSTVYFDNQLAVYKVDNVLLPLGIFGPHPPAPAPSPTKSKKPSASFAPSSKDASVHISGNVVLNKHVAISSVLAVVAALCL